MTLNLSRDNPDEIHTQSKGFPVKGTGTKLLPVKQLQSSDGWSRVCIPALPLNHCVMVAKLDNILKFLFFFCATYLVKTYDLQCC